MQIIGISRLDAVRAGAGRSAGPRTPTEATLADIWCETLGLQTVSVEDNFFDLGGSSVVAARIVGRIDERLSVRMPVVALLHAPTIAELAAALGKATWTPLVPLQPKGGRPPFFCVHPVGGHVMQMRSLAERLGPDQPFYGIEALGVDGVSVPNLTIEAMAAYDIEAMRAKQAEGPYFLGGYSFGGVVAYEMAQQLRAQGETVGLLVLLDSIGPLAVDDPLRQRIALAALDARELAVHLWRRPGRLVLRQAAALKNWAVRHVRRAAPRTTADAIRRLKRVNMTALRRYRARSYRGPVLLLSSTEKTLEEQRHYSLLGWDRLIPEGLYIQPTPGTHWTMMGEPQVGETAALLVRYLREAQAGRWVDVANNLKR